MNISIKNPSKADTFCTLFQHVRLFTEHINIMFEKERVYMQSMDSSHVSIFEFTLPSTWFDVYEHTNHGNMSLGISSTLLFKILNTRDKSQETNIVFNSEENDKLFVNFTSTNSAVFDKHFEIPLIDLDCELMDIPTTECNAEFSIPSSNFANIISQLKMFGDTIDIECNEEKIELKSLSDGAGKMSVDISIEELSEYAIDEGETIRLSFSLTILHNICQYNKIAKDMEIQLIKDYPMKIKYSLGEQDANLTFYLAPKINDD